MKKWIVIDKNKPLKPGDLIELDFKILGGLWMSSTEIALIEWSLSKRDDWEILSNSLPAAGRITFKVRVKDQAQGSWLQPGTAGIVVTGTVVAVTAAKIAAAICAVGLVMSLVLYEVRQFVEVIPESFEKLVETPVGKIAVAGMGSLGIALLILVIGKYAKWK